MSPCRWTAVALVLAVTSTAGCWDWQRPPGLMDRDGSTAGDLRGDLKATVDARADGSTPDGKAGDATDDTSTDLPADGTSPDFPPREDGAPPDVGVDGATPDVGVDSGVDSAPPDIGVDSAPPYLTCPTDPTLVACYRFESGAVGTDASTNANHLTVSQISSLPGIEGSAVQLGLASRLKAPHIAALVPAKVTVEVWLDLDKLPTTSQGRVGILDKNSAYGIFARSTGEVSCIIGTDVRSALPIQRWVHLACSFDGSTTRLFIDGKAAASSNNGTAPSGTAALVVGGDSPNEDQRMQGSLDSLRIWNTARSANQICAAAAAGGKVCP